MPTRLADLLGRLLPGDVTPSDPTAPQEPQEPATPERFYDLIELLGLAFIAFAFYSVLPALGFLVIGLFLFLVGNGGLTKR